MSDYHQLRREREIIDAAAARLRSRAFREAYDGDGHEDKHITFGLALVLDKISRHLGQVDEAVRRAAPECCAELAAESPPQRASRVRGR
jgi:hypothetical protein